MTKDELIEALQPFTDDIEIVLLAGQLFYEIDHATYGTNSRDDGVLVLVKGAQVIVPTLAAERRADTSSERP